MIYNLVACLRVMLAAGAGGAGAAAASAASGPGAPGAPRGAAGPDGVGAQLCRWLARLLLACAEPGAAPGGTPQPAPEAKDPGPPPRPPPAPRTAALTAAAAAAAVAQPRRSAGVAIPEPAAAASPGPERMRRSGRGSMIVATPAVLPPALERVQEHPAAPLDTDGGSTLSDNPEVRRPAQPELTAVTRVMQHFVAADDAFAALRAANRTSRERPSRGESRRASLFSSAPPARSLAAPVPPATNPGP